jgi:hypothetical protein
VWREIVPAIFLMRLIVAKVIEAFVGCKDGELYGTEFKIGDEVEGELAEIALREGWAEKADASPKPVVPDAPKALRNAPENK